MCNNPVSICRNRAYTFAIRAQWRYRPPVSECTVPRHPLRTRDSAEHGQRHPAVCQRRLHAASDRTAGFHTRGCPPAPRRSRLPRIRLGPDLAGAERLSARSARLAALRVRDRLSAPLHGGEFPAGRCAAVRSGDPALAAGHHRHAGTGRASAPADAARQSQPEPVQRGGRCGFRSLAPARFCGERPMTDTTR